MILRLLATQRRSTRMPPSGVVSSEAAARALARAARALALDMALAPERAARAARALALERARCVYTWTFHFHCCSAIAGILFCENEANLTHHLSFTLVLQPLHALRAFIFTMQGGSGSGSGKGGSKGGSSSAGSSGSSSSRSHYS